MSISHVVGIAGGSCSGKGYLCDHLIESFTNSKSLILPMDCYYKDISHLSIAERNARNYDHPDAFDYELCYSHLTTLISGGEVEIPSYDFRTHSRLFKEPKVNAVGKTIILEGIFALYWPKIRGLLNLKVFIELDPSICLSRRIERDGAERGRSRESVISQYRETVLPMYDKFIKSTRNHSDLTINGEQSASLSIKEILFALRYKCG
jgi:uridine kinase